MTVSVDNNEKIHKDRMSHPSSYFGQIHGHGTHKICFQACMPASSGKGSGSVCCVGHAASCHCSGPWNFENKHILNDPAHFFDLSLVGYIFEKELTVACCSFVLFSIWVSQMSFILFSCSISTRQIEKVSCPSKFPPWRKQSNSRQR